MKKQRIKYYLHQVLALRMGQSDFAKISPTFKNALTFGFEVEVSCGEDFDGGDESVLRERFEDQYTNEVTEESFWEENKDNKTFLQSIQATPIFGWDEKWISCYTSEREEPEEDEDGEPLEQAEEPESIGLDYMSFTEFQNLFDYSVIRWETKLDQAISEAEDDAFTVWMDGRDTTDSVEHVYRLFEDYIGRQHRVVHSPTKKENKNKDWWYVEPDGSIEPEGTGAEIVSPVMTVDEGLAAIQEVFEFIDHYDFDTNDSTGLHINIGHPDWGTSTLDVTKLILLVGDQHVLKEFGREDNDYAVSSRERLTDILKKEEFVKKEYNSAIRDLNRSAIQQAEKYSSVNLKKLSKGFIEFRATGGQGYHTQYDKVKNTIMRYIKALEAASDSMMDRKTYLKKLMGFVPRESLLSVEESENFSRFALDHTASIRQLMGLCEAKLDANAAFDLLRKILLSSLKAGEISQEVWVPFAILISHYSLWAKLRQLLKKEGLAEPRWFRSSDYGRKLP